MHLLGSVDLGDLGSLFAVVISVAALALSWFTWQNERKRDRAISVVTLQRRWLTDLAGPSDVLRALLTRIDARARSANAKTTAEKESSAALWEAYRSVDESCGNQEIAAGRTILAFAVEILELRDRGLLDVEDIHQIFDAEGVEFLRRLVVPFANLPQDDPRPRVEVREPIERLVTIITHQSLRELLSLLSVRRRRSSRSRAAS